MRTALFTICARNYLPYARTLMASVEAQQPDAERVTVLADAREGRIEEGVLGRLIFAEDLGLPSFEHFAFRYDVTEFNTAIKPFVIQRLMDEGYERVLYVDPDIKLYRPLDDALATLENGANAVLTPHILHPVVEDDEPNDLTILRAGVYNLGFAGFRRSEQTKAYLNWWCRRLEHECLFNRLESGIFVDQKWVDLLPSFADQVSILRHPGYNVAYWNLMNRRLERGTEGYTVNDAPLVFFHFSGVVPGNRSIFSKHQKRFTPGNVGAPARELFDGYLDDLEAHGVREARNDRYAYGFFEDGQPIVPAMRYIFREELEPFDGNPFSAAADRFNEPDPRVGRMGALLVTRLMYRIWRERPDLRVSFDLRTAEGQEGLMHWYLATAGTELGVGERFVEPVRRATLAVRQGRERSGGMLPSPAGGGMLRFLRRYKHWYQYLPATPRKRVKNVVLRLSGLPPQPLADDGVEPDYGLVADQASEPTATANGAEAGVGNDGVLLVGYAKAEMGVGQGIRMQARALEAAGIDFRVYNVDAADVYRQSDHLLQHRFVDHNPFALSIHHVNADQVANVHEHISQSAREGYAIGYWAWELERFPEAWHGAFDSFDEIWVPSSFVQRAVAAETSKPVLVVPHAVSRPEHCESARSEHEIGDDVFLVLSCFDFNSFMSRKNPVAGIEAFQSAFPRDRQDVVLLLKTHGGDARPDLLEELMQHIGSDRRIRLVDEVLSADRLVRLQASADVFLSLHRSEGFGLNIAECMALGKPAVATAYSGNVDYMHVGNSCPVDYELVSVAEGDYPFAESQVWAEPDIEHAARLLRHLYENRDWRLQIGARAQDDVRARYSVDAIGSKIKHRLQIIGAQRH